MSDIRHFPDISIVNGHVQVFIHIDRFSDQFIRAQQWLGARVLEDCKPLMPLVTGGQQQRSHTENNGRRVVFPGPSGRFLYMGKVMVDPDTGSPWARRGVKKVVTNRPLHYSRPGATSHWFDAAKARNGEYWIEGVKRIAGGG